MVNSGLQCAQPDGFVSNSLDCDDTNEEIHPDAVEIANDGIDQDCDGEDLTIGVEEILAAELKVFPNPAKSVVTVQLPKSIGEAQFELLDVTGKVVLRERLIQEQSTIELRGTATGMYTYRIASSIAQFKGKLLVE